MKPFCLLNAGFCLFLIAAACSAQPATRPAAMEVRVVDDVTGEALAGVEVRGYAAHADAPLEEFKATGDADGRVTVSLPAGDFAGVSLTADAAGHVPVDVGWAADGAKGPPASVTLRLPRGTTVGGRVVGEDGRPAGGARLLLMAEPADGWGNDDGVPYARLARQFVTADAAGRWICDRAPAKWARFLAEAAHPDYVDSSGLVTLDDAALRDATATLTLLRGRPFRGKIVNQNGSFVNGATVELEATAAENEGRFVADAAGHFDAGRVRAESFVVLVRAPRRAPLLRRMAAEERTDDVTLTLPPGHEVAVHLRTPSGAPSAGWVRFAGTDKLRVPVWHFENVGNDGELRLWLPDESAELDVAGTGTNGTRQSVTIPPDAAEWTVTIARPPTVTVRAIDATTGLAVTPDRVAVSAKVKGHGDWQPATAAGDGFTATLPGPAKETFAQAEKPGYAVGRSATRPAVDEDVTLTVELEPAKPILGRVVDADGEPAAGAALARLPAGLGYVGPTAPMPRGPGSWADAFAGDDGTFQLPPDVVARGLFARTPGGYAVQSFAGFDGTLRLRPWRPVAVNIAASGGPVAGFNVTWRGSAADVLGAVEVEMDGVNGVTVATDATGRATIPTAGDAGLVTIAPPGGPDFLRLWQRWGRDDAAASLSLELSAGVAGRAVVPPDAPAGWAYEFAVLARPADAAADPATAPNWSNAEPDDGWPAAAYCPVAADGRFRFKAVEPGRYLLSVSAGVPATGWACSLGMPAARERRWVDVAAGGNDLGDVILKPVPRPEVGDPAPPFTAATLDGKPSALQSLAGKVIVIDFWATWCPPCVAAVPEVRKLAEQFAGDDRVVVLSLSADQSPDDAARFVASHAMAAANWRQVYGGFPSSVMQAYGVPSLPSVWVIAPDGRVAARDLKIEDAAAAVRTVLGE